MQLLPWAGLWLLACRPEPTPPPPAPRFCDPATPAEAAAPEATVPIGAIAFTQAPELELNPSETTPLALVATTWTDRPGTVELTLRAADHTWHQELPVDGSCQAWPVVGLLADTTYTATFVARSDQGATAPVERSITTPPLPADFPRLEVLHAEPERMEPGLTLLAPSAPGNSGRAYVVAIDERGRVVWFHTVSRYAAEAHLDDDGHLVYLETRRQVEVVDLLGRSIRTLWPLESRFAPPGAIGPPLPVLHHDVHPLPGGDLLGLSVEARTVDEVPTSDTDPAAPTASARLAGDVIVRFDRQGQVVARFDVLDLLDPQRIGYDVLDSSYWHYLFGDDALDWSHGNNVVYRPEVDRYVFTARNQDAVAEVDGATGELTWLLAPESGWGPAHQGKLLRPTGPSFRHAYHPHGPEWTPDGTLLLFDNGTHGASAFEPPLPDDALTSRAVEFAIDGEAMTVEQVWSYEPGWYAAAMGDADHLPETRNVLAVFGTLSEADAGEVSALIHEVTRTQPPETVFELAVYRADGENVDVREADRIPSLYVGGVPRPLP